MLAMKGNALQRLINYTLTNPEGYDSYRRNIFFSVEHKSRTQKVAASPRRKEPLVQTQTEKMSVWLALTFEVICFSK